MKRLSVVILLVGLVGCKYPSRRQAEIGCNVWADRKREVTFVETIPAKPYKSTLEQDLKEIEDFFSSGIGSFSEEGSIENAIKRDKKKKADSRENKVSHEITARWCFEEEKTNQFLGYENLRATKGTWENKKGMTSDEKIIKHFRY